MAHAVVRAVSLEAQLCPAALLLGPSLVWRAAASLLLLGDAPPRDAPTNAATAAATAVRAAAAARPPPSTALAELQHDARLCLLLLLLLESAPQLLARSVLARAPLHGAPPQLRAATWQVLDAATQAHKVERSGTT